MYDKATHSSVLAPVFFLLGVQPLLDHGGQEVLVGRGLVPAHVKEDSIDGLEDVEHLARLLGEEFLVGRGHIHDLPAGHEHIGRPLHLAAVGLAGDPLGMGVGGVFVALHRDVDGGADAFAMQRLDLAFEQAEALSQARMSLGAPGVVVEVPVMALGEDGDAVDVRPLHGAGEFARVEVARRHRGSPARCGNRDGSGGREA